MNRKSLKKRRIFVVVTGLTVACIHFITGPQYRGPFKDFVIGYLIDILLPFALYFMATIKFERWSHKIVAACCVFLVGVTIELLQYFNLPILGRTFDPLDFLMYGLGILLALIIDSLIISRKINPNRSEQEML
jgi:hypothetical protein